MKHLATATLLATLTACATTPASPTPVQHTGPELAHTTLETITIAPESDRDTYERDAFSDWVTVITGCDTRDMVLLEEDMSGRVTADDCGSRMTGEWYSAYDGVTVTDSSDLDIDHMVPLAEAWESGAADWSPEKRADYATWLEDPDHLIAVTAASNRSKGDRDPAEWLPADEAAWCWYAQTWTRIKEHWGLTADPAEYDALAGILSACQP